MPALLQNLPKPTVSKFALLADLVDYYDLLQHVIKLLPLIDLQSEKQEGYNKPGHC